MNKSLRNQRGVGHLGLIVAVLVVVAAGAVGWYVYNKNQDKPSNSLDASVQEAIKNAKCEYDDKDLCKFFSGWKAQQYYTMASTSEADGQKTSMTIMAEGDDKSHMKVDGEMSYEVITIGKTTYTKAADGTWWKQTLPETEADKYTADSQLSIDEPEGDNNDVTKTSYKKLGKEACGDLTCFKYQEVDPSSKTTTYLWFDDKDYQLRRTQTVEEDGSKYDATFSYSKVSISEPKPVKELGPNQYLVPGQSEPTTLPATGDGPSPEELEALMQQYQ